MIRALQEGGSGAYFIFLLLGPGAFAAGVVHAIVCHQTTRLVAAAALMLVLLAGVGFTMLGYRQTEAALGAVDPTMRNALEEQGHKEAERCFQFALGWAAPALAALVVGEVRLRRRAQ